MSKADTPVDQPAPTQEQVTAANEAEKAKWEPDFKEEDLKIPYKREEDDADTDTRENAGDKSGSAKDTEENKTGGESADETTEETYTEPTLIVTVEDPGEYTPQDYSFEIEIDGKNYKVETAEQAEELADEHAEKLTAKQLGTLIRKGARIEINQEKDKAEWQKQKDTYEKQAGEQASRMEYIQQIDKEVQYLIDSGALPKITDPEVKKRWETDPNASNDKEFIKNDGVREQIELLQRLATERDRRVKAGLSPLVSAIEVMKDIQIERAKNQEKDYEAGERRRAASSKVAGVSPTGQGVYAPKGVAVGKVLNFRDQGWS